jgi:hypothetical protein
MGGIGRCLTYQARCKSPPSSFQHPSSDLAPASLGSATFSLKGRREGHRAFHHCHARHSPSGFCQRALLATGAEVGKRGAWPSLSIYIYVAQLPRPAGVLAPAEDTAVAAGLRQGPDLGVHHPAAHRFAAGPAPSPATLARFATRVPVQEMRRVSLRASPREENRCDFFAGGAEASSLVLQDWQRFQRFSQAFRRD